jgi:hypothetical protein
MNVYRTQLLDNTIDYLIIGTYAYVFGTNLLDEPPVKVHKFIKKLKEASRCFWQKLLNSLGGCRSF